MIRLTFQLEICPSCVCETANGESDLTETELTTHYAKLDELADIAGVSVPMGLVFKYEDESWFSHRRCDLCKALAGDRYMTQVYA